MNFHENDDKNPFFHLPSELWLMKWLMKLENQMLLTWIP